jgi:hypothetical protein
MAPRGNFHLQYDGEVGRLLDNMEKAHEIENLIEMSTDSMVAQVSSKKLNEISSKNGSLNVGAEATGASPGAENTSSASRGDDNSDQGIKPAEDSKPDILRRRLRLQVQRKLRQRLREKVVANLTTLNSSLGIGGRYEAGRPKTRDDGSAGMDGRKIMILRAVYKY